MNCSDFEILAADYIDRTLSMADRAAFEEHAAGCAACAEFLRDAAGAVEFLERIPALAPPPELVTRIAYQAPSGRVRDPLDRPGLLSRLALRWLHPLLQPRFAMGMAMTILSFAMLERCTGIQVQHIQAADLNPVRVWDGVEDKVIRAKDRAVKYYENIRLVYEIQSRLKEMEAQQEASQQPPSKRAAKRSGQSGSQDQSTTRGEPR